jgi:hypothetical protein
MTQIALSVCLLSTSGLALAGRDASQIDMQDKASKAAAQEAADRAAAQRLLAQSHFLPLDHGPHAAATPWSNRRVVELRMEAERNSYASAMAKE